MATQAIIETLHVLHCAECGILFGITQDFDSRRRKDHESFVCPKGHSNYYSQESEAERLARQLRQANDTLARVRANADQRETELTERVRHCDARINGYKGAITRTKRRVANGRCPCCSHQFKNLESHMKTRHPDWNPEKHAEAIAAKS